MMYKQEGHIGNHLIADLYDVSICYLTNLELIKDLLYRAAKEAGAAPIAANFHHFGENLGVTGVLLLKESHISIHTWPEFGFAAVDIFMCGDTKPEKAIGLIKNNMMPGSVNITNINRGKCVSLGDFR